MLTIYNLKNKELLEKHLASIKEILVASTHSSVYSNLSSSELENQLYNLLENNGLILKSAFGENTTGILIAQIRKANEFGVLEFWIYPNTEQRIIDLLFRGCERELKRRKFKAIYCNHDWFVSVQNKAIANKFINQ